MSDNMSGTSEPERRRNGSDDQPEGMVGRTVRPAKEGGPGEGPDVHLNVPLLKVDEISLEVENLEAHVSLVAQVLDLLKLNVGADAFLGTVKLEIKGVEAEARLDVRLDNVALIVDRVLTTLDRNPEILQHVGRGVEEAARSIGGGTGTAVGEVGKGAKRAVEDVGEGAGGAVKDVGSGAGEGVRDVGKGAGGAVEDVGEGAGGAVKDVGSGAGEGVRDVGKGAGGAVEDVGEGAGGAAQDLGKETGGAVEGAERTAQAAGQGNAAPADQNDRPPGDTGAEPKDTGENSGTSGGDQEITALQSALRETGDSVHDLGRALFRVVSQQSRSAKE